MQIIAANKADVMQDEENYNKLTKIAKQKGYEIFKISAIFPLFTLQDIILLTSIIQATSNSSQLSSLIISG